MRRSTASVRSRFLLGLTVTLFVLVPIVLALGVELPGTQPADGSGAPGFPLFQNGNQVGTFDSPGQCENCHGGYRNAGEPIYEPYDSWAGSMMAQAGRDPLFWAAVDIANQDDGARLGDVGIGDFCIRCHAPKAWYEGRSHCDNAWGEPFDGSCMSGNVSAENNDFEGLTCHFCHRQYDASIAPVGDFFDANAPYEANGQVYLSREERLMRGPYSDASPPGRHAFAVSILHRESAFCGQCHNVTNPALNRRDEVTGADLGYLMPVERTYDEWRQSDFANVASEKFASCQRCHMPPPDLDGDGDVDPAFACSSPPGPRGEDTALEGPIWTHGFPGGGSWMLEVLKDEYGAALGRQNEFDAAIAGARALLQGRTASIGVETPAAAMAGGAFDATAVVTNLAGHKLPTGYPEGRRAWVHLRAGHDADADGTLAAGEVSYESGAWNAATGELSHVPELKIYEIKVGIWNWNGTGRCDLVDDVTGRKMFHFVLNDCVVSDTRIPPEGFLPNDETAPVGYVYPENPGRPGRLAHWDRTAYSVPVPVGATGAMLVEARLLYQTTSEDFIEFLARESVSTCDPHDSGCNPTLADARPNRGEKVEALWGAYGRSAPVTIAATLASVPITAGAGIPGEAADPRFAAEQLLVEAYDPATGDITVRFGLACDSSDHALYYGPLAAVSTYGWDGALCSIGSTGTTVFDPGDRSAFFLVTGHDSVVEGSLGKRAPGVERPESNTDALCPLQQDLGETCMAP